MSKELEALLRELKLLKDDIKGCEIKEVRALIPHLGIGNPNPQQHLLEHIETVERLLTPPTQEEVCEALSKHLDRVVKFDGENFYYVEQKQYYGECDEIICGWSWSPKTISFEIDFPPHLITLIGCFYEGLGK